MIYSLALGSPNIDPTAWVAPEAVVSGRVTLGPLVSIWHGSVLRGDLEPIVVGEGSNIQDLCVLHTDHGLPTRIGAYVTVGHRAIVHGAVVGDGCLIGMGAIVMGGAVLEDECLVGAGSVVPQNKRFPARSLILGVPARLVRVLSAEEIESIRKNALHYIELMQATRSALRS